MQIDGRSARLAGVDGALLGTVLGPGAHVVTFRYHAPDFEMGALISGFSLLVAFGLVVVDRNRNRGASSGGAGALADGGSV